MKRPRVLVPAVRDGSDDDTALCEERQGLVRDFAEMGDRARLAIVANGLLILASVCGDTTRRAHAAPQPAESLAGYTAKVPSTPCSSCAGCVVRPAPGQTRAAPAVIQSAKLQALMKLLPALIAY